MKRLLFIIPVALAALLSCSRSEPEQPEAESDRIVFLAKEANPFGAPTRVTETTASTLNSNGIYVGCTQGAMGSETAVWSNTAFSLTGGVFDGNKRWPDSNPSYHFVSSNVPLTFDAEGTTVSASNSTDVVCAFLPAPSYKQKNTLYFEHIFARLGNVTFSAATGYTITGISVTITPYTGGTYCIRQGAGHTDGTGWSDKVEGSATSIANSTPGTKSNDIWLVPGQYLISASWRAQAAGTYDKTFTNVTKIVDLAAGAINTIHAEFAGDAKDIEFSISMQSWDNLPVAIGTYPISGNAGGISGTIYNEMGYTTLSSASQSISFTGLSGQPKAFMIMLSLSGGNLGASTPGVQSVVYDSDTNVGTYTTGTQHNYASGFASSYSGGTLTVTAPDGVTFAAQTYDLVSFYGSGNAGWREATYTPGSGVTTASITGLAGFAWFFMLQLETQVTSESYHRVAYCSAYGVTRSALNFYSNNVYDINGSISVGVEANGSITIDSGGTNAGGYFHNPGTYKLYYFISDEL